MEEFIIERVEDLSFDKDVCPLSEEARKIWMQYTDNNIILDNGQMVCLNFTQEIKDKISDHCKNILTEFIESEKNFQKCCQIRDRYISNIDDINNTSSYVKLIFNIIIDMDRANKYLWNISKILVDNIEEYKQYVSWQEQTTKIGKEIREKWNLVYNIRNEIEHPTTLRTTSFARVKGGSVIPQIIYEGKNYDLLEIAKDALECVYIFLKAIMGASFLYSKYVVAFTDESRKILYGIDK